MTGGHADASIRFAEVRQAGRSVQLEYHWVGVRDEAVPLLVFLHEGLGSASMWRRFPERLCEDGGWRGLVYSCAGYGRSTPRPHGERWTPDHMHVQATQVLPADEYGTLALVDRLSASVPQAEVIKLDDCAHSPHRDQPEAVTAAVVDFIRRQISTANRSAQALRGRRHHHEAS
jgi:pimeloyl-ACP methyl ester carboxylesterase